MGLGALLASPAQRVVDLQGKILTITQGYGGDPFVLGSSSEHPETPWLMVSASGPIFLRANAGRVKVSMTTHLGRFLALQANNALDPILARHSFPLLSSHETPP